VFGSRSAVPSWHSSYAAARVAPRAEAGTACPVLGRVEMWRGGVRYDHARHAPLGDVITLDFINMGLEPGAHAGIELTLETAKELRAALDRAIAAAEFEEAEVRGKGAVPSLVRAA